MSSSSGTPSAYQSEPPVKFGDRSGRVRDHYLAAIAQLTLLFDVQPDITGILSTSVDKTRTTQTQVSIQLLRGAELGEAHRHDRSW